MLVVLGAVTPSLRAQDTTFPLGNGSPSSSVQETDHGSFVAMMFPVFGSARFQKELIDTWGDPRGGGTRRHEGQDMMAPQMTPLLAAFDGVVSFNRTDAPNAHNTLYLTGDNGWEAVYMHINNDMPKTNDGKGSREYAFAPNLRPGQRVIAGQFLGYVGNSGNAETVGHHLHFELHNANGPVNAYMSLKRAQRLTSARWNAPHPEILPGRDEIRLDATVRETQVSAGRISVFCVAWRNAAGKTSIETRPNIKWIRIDDRTAFVGQDDSSRKLSDIQPGDYLIVLAVAREDVNGILARRISVDPTPERAAVANRQKAVLR